IWIAHELPERGARGQIAQPAMEKPARAARRARGEIALVDQQDMIAGGGEVLRGTGAVDARADDRDIEGLAVQSAQCCSHASLPLSLTTAIPAGGAASPAAADPAWD